MPRHQLHTHTDWGWTIGQSECWAIKWMGPLLSICSWLVSSLDIPSFTEHLLCARDCIKHLVWVTSFGIYHRYSHVTSLQFKILVLLLLVFCLKVRDQEFPYRRNLARVIVNVEDANDHSPYFTNPLYEASVFESAALGSAVLQVTALDKDKGENAELIYTIEAGESCCTDCNIMHGICPSVVLITMWNSHRYHWNVSQRISWPSNCPICVMMLYRVLGIPVICFPSLTVRREFPLIVLFSDFSGMKGREEMGGELSDFYWWVDKPWPWTKITKAFHLLRAARLSYELDPTSLCLLVSGQAVGFKNTYTPTVCKN